MGVSKGSVTRGKHVGKIRVVLADDHQEVIARIRGTLGDEFEVVEAVANGNQAVIAVLASDPDVLVIDISMPILDGLQAARKLQKNNCRVKIIFLTIHEDREFIAAALSTGAMGYVTKPRLSTDLVFAIHEALKGNIFVSDLKRI
ncbi:MAG TPA: response regulator transcription factor [Edaphobacter sp.]|nr:response regulator transcription factor [Edaphobacter sp.]